jgi:NADH pyrophosphatase NudC (nudix superfamily)
MQGSTRFCPRCATPLAPRLTGGRERLACPGPECGFVLYDNPLPVVAALVEHEGDVLLVRSVGWPETWYGLVTGFLERDEEPEAGVLRELREELGLEGRVVAPIGVYTFPERNELILAYHIEARGEVRLGSELADFKRIRPEKLRPWPFGTGHAVRDWLATRAARLSPPHQGDA